MDQENKEFIDKDCKLKNQQSEDKKSSELMPCLNEINRYKTETKFTERKLLVNTLVIFFGISSWLSVNGLYIELPVLVEELPEGWKLPSYMSTVVQIANIGPVLYWIFRKFFARRNLDSIAIYCLLGIGCVSVFLTAYLYQITTFFAGSQRSIIFLTFLFFSSLVCCTSSVLFFPYMRHFKEIYLTMFLIGEGLSAFIPSIIALIQGIGGNPDCISIKLPDGNFTTQLLYHEARFGAKSYFLSMAVILAASLVSFFLLNNLKSCRSELVMNSSQTIEDFTGKTESDKGGEMTKFRYWSLLIVKATVCGLCNGLLPSLQSYSCLPYGNTTFHLAITLSRIANPVACFLGLFFTSTSNASIGLITSAYTAIVAYIVAISLMSPNPILMGTTAGEFLIVISWILAFGFMSYIKLSISRIFRMLGGSALFYCGAVSQIGSMIICFLTFFLVSKTDVFGQSEPCIQF